MKTSISISIDLTDDFEKKLLKYVEGKGNKSRYIKRLIHEDLMGVKALPVAVYQEEETDEDKEAAAKGGFF